MRIRKNRLLKNYEARRYDLANPDTAMLIGRSFALKKQARLTKTAIEMTFIY